MIIEEKNYKRIIVVGDLHGYLAPLEELLEKISLQEEDLLLFIGDYIDRGPHSKDVVQKMVELKNSLPHVVFLKGNHEDMFLGSVGYPSVVNDINTWFYNGGISTLKSYGMETEDIKAVSRMWEDELRLKKIMEVVPESHMKFFQELELFVESENFFFCHAGVDPYSSLEEGKENIFDLLWMRDHIYTDHHIWEKTVVCGHTPLEEVMITNSLICVDTGLYYYGKLSAVDVLSGGVYQVTRV